MDHSYNKLGVQYTIFQQNSAVKVSGYLGPEAMKYLISLERAVARSSIGETEANKCFLGSINGCLHHLYAFLFQVERMVEHVSALRRIPSKTIDPAYPIEIFKENWQGVGSPVSAPALVRVRIDLVEYDFIQLLLTGVATLERLATFVSLSLAGRQCDYYHLKSELNCCADSRAAAIVKIVDVVAPKLTDVLVSGSQKSLRNKIAHLSSIPELTDRSMLFHLLPGNKILRFDSELAEFPLLKTAHVISGVLPYLIAAACGEMFRSDASGKEISGRGEFARVDPVWFAPAWVNPTVYFDDYIDPTGKGPLMPFIKPGLHEFTIDNKHLRTEVFDHQEEFLV